MIEIRLSKDVWTYDPDSQLGPSGGFGAVFNGYSESRGEVAVKKLHLAANEAAHRELRIAKELTSKSFEHIIPVYDFGQDANSSSYFVVMAKADYSLQDAMNSTSDGLVAMEVLLQIAMGLCETSDFVHRDLKPGNVLFHENAWKIADFGIARFVEESTSLNTLKECLSPQYAAPEQWLFEHSTSATDVYALGCIAHYLVSGRPPFAGPQLPDYRDQHLHQPPSSLSCDPKLNTLINMMLRKQPRGRPNIQRVISIIKECIVDYSREIAGHNAVAEAAAAAAQKEAARLAVTISMQSDESKRRELAYHAYEQLKIIGNEICEAIERSAPNSRRKLSGGTIHTFRIEVGDASFILEMEPHYVHPTGEFKQSGWGVLASAAVGVVQRSPEYKWWSSLWYTNLGMSTLDFRWYEVSYFRSALMRGQPKFAPFHLSTEPSKADEAAGPAMCAMNIAFGPVPIDDENQEEFHDRWMKLFAKAINGELCYPSSFPLTNL